MKPTNWKEKNMEPFDELKKEYPKIFDSDFFFEVKEGWIQLLRKMCQEFSKLPAHSIKKAAQVKSKFGGLRFYTENYSELMQTIIKKYEVKSFYICEDCGSEILERDNVKYHKTQCVICLVNSA